jgi:hypothetical protein
VIVIVRVILIVIVIEIGIVIVIVYVCIYPFSREGGHHLYGIPGPPHGGSLNHIGLFKLEPKPVRKDHSGSNLVRFQHTLLYAWIVIVIVIVIVAQTWG